MKIYNLLPFTLTVLFAGCNATHPAAANDLSQAKTPTARGALALAQLQHPTGAFPGPAGADHVGITALAGLALLSAADVPPSTTASHIDSAANFILNSQKKDGYLFNVNDSAGMYGHAFATLFLTQLHATTTDPAKKEKLAAAIKKAVHLIESAQSSQGGWRYTPTPADADVSVTAAQVKALVAAKEQGFSVADTTLAHAISYLKSAQQPDGGFAYTLQSGGSGWPRSAAATAALLYAGAGGGRDTSKALAYLQKPEDHSVAFFYYGNFYFAQALNLGDPDKTKSTAALRAALLAKQNPTTGLWTGEAGDAYATSMALIILYMPTTNLPAFKPR